MQKELRLQFWIVFAFLLIVSSPLVFATQSCVEDTDCASLGDSWACDTSSGECVELDFGTSTEESTDDSIEDTTTTETEEETVSADETTTNDNSELEASISDIDSRVTGLETTIDELGTQIEELTTTVDDINSNVQLLSTDQYQLEREISQQVDSIESQVSTGLAVLQEDLKTTKTDLEGTKETVQSSEARASFFRTLSIVVILIAIFGALGYFLRTHKREEEKIIPPDVIDYITKQIKLGTSEKNIVDALEKSGWPEHDAKWAFEQTTVKNYNDFLSSQGKSTKAVPKHKLTNSHYQKIATVSILSIILLGVLLFFVKQSVGFAVYYEGITSADLALLVEETIESSIDQNSFYSLIDYADLCIQVNEEDISTSFRVLKTPYGHSTTAVSQNCDATSEDYDFAVSFSSWNSFELLSNTMTCNGFELAHSVQSNSVAARGMYILPSYYVAQGFSLVTDRDYSDFCPALALCLSSSDLALLGIDC